MKTTFKNAFFALVIVCASLMLTNSTGCGGSGGGTSNNSTTHTLVNLEMKGTGLAGKSVEGTVEFSYLKEGATQPFVKTINFKEIADPAGEYKVKFGKLIEHGKYKFQAATYTWQSKIYDYEVKKAGQIWITFTSGSLGDPEVIVF